MLLSMTGYGKAETAFHGKKLVAELRSLNSKSMDINLRCSSIFREKELDMRNIIASRLERGKIDAAVYIEDSLTEQKDFTPINIDALNYYVQQLTEYADKNGLPKDGILPSVLRFPDVLRANETEEFTDEDWKIVADSLNNAVEQFIAFRTQEGAALQAMFTEKLNGIADLLAQVEPFEKGRIEKIRQHLEDNLAQLSATTQQQIDRNRLEQEMIYYLEKLDITEEKVRLTNHIKYFRETMEQNGAGVGKKLGFIAQEMGREINTLGSKSNQSEMQIIVVKMKDILEQIKEQVLNVL